MSKSRANNVSQIFIIYLYSIFHALYVKIFFAFVSKTLLECVIQENIISVILIQHVMINYVCWYLFVINLEIDLKIVSTPDFISVFIILFNT